MAIPAKRERVYTRLKGLVGKTPLYEIKNIKIANNCRIFCKEENLNPTGSHYDRFWVDYLRYFELNHGIQNNGIPIVETSTGNSGASFAWVCRSLGFKDYRVVIPADMPYARKAQIMSYGATIHESPKEKYVGGLIEEFQYYIKDLRNQYGTNIYIPNHALNGENSINTMGDIAKEISDELAVKEINSIDYFISALGNGISTKGMGQFLKRRYPRIKLIGMEPEESPNIYLKTHPGAPKPDTYGKTHGLIGTGPGNTEFNFPIIQSYIQQIDDYIQVKRTDWESMTIQLEDYEGKFVGHTSAACVYAALEYAKKAEEGSVIITVFYDSAWKYL